MFVVTTAFINSSAQLCQGSLGDPIVNITFGSGTNPGAPLPGATTNYQYYSSDCPDDGFYTVRNSSNSCFGNTWHSLISDHTGNTNGYFMLVNASFQPSAFYIDTVDLLCSNTTYEFAAWVMNVIKINSCNGNTIQPNLTFRIERLDGTVIQSYNTGNIPALTDPTWKQYGFFFSTPSNISKVVLKLINNAPGGCGNDLALDDITFKPCGPLLKAAIDGVFTQKNLCEGESAQYIFSSDVSGYTNPHIQWQQSTGNGPWIDITGANAATLSKDFFSNTPAGIYKYRVTVVEVENIALAQCRVASGVLTITVNAKPVTTASNNGPACEGTTISLSATGGITYDWNGPNGFTAIGQQVNLNNLTQLHSGRYYVQVTNAAGCKRIDSTDIIIRAAPNAIVSADTVSICKGDSISIVASGGISYVWSPVSALSSSTVANPKASPAQSTTYKVKVSDQFNCSDSANVHVIVFDKPVVDAGNDKVIVAGQSVLLNGNVLGSADYFWSPNYNINNVNLLQPLVNPLIDTLYFLNAVSLAGCGTVSDTVRINVLQKIIIPNAFSPNGDGINDKWTIPALQAYPNFEIFIFNRYGQIIFKSKNIFSWDGNFNGKPLPVGSYYYVIDVKEQSSIKGWLLLIR